MDKIILFAGGLVIGIVITVIYLMTVFPGKLFLVSESKYGFEETNERIAELANDYNWSLPHVYDLQATMEKNGINVLPVKVFSMCQPQHAGKILSGEKERVVSAMMPCRVSVYEGKDGKTYISRMNATLMSKLMKKNVKNIMGEVAVENEKILEPLVK